VRARGIRFGVYYSGGLDRTFDARPIAHIGDLIAAAPGARTRVTPTRISAS